MLKNYFSLVGAEAFSKLVTFAALAYLARTAGAEGFGQVEFAAAVTMCAGLIVEQGFNAYGAREIARSETHNTSLVMEIVAVRFALAAIGYAIVALFALSAARTRAAMTLILVYGVSLWATPLLLQWVFQGHDRMNLVAAAQAIRQAVFAGVILLCVRDRGDLIFVGVAEVAATFCAATFCVIVYRRRFYESTHARIRITKRLFREGVPIGLSQIFWVVRMSGATLLLGSIASGEETGRFAAALRILIAAHTFVWLYNFNLLPSLSRAWQKANGSFQKLIHDSMHIAAWSGATICVMWIATASDAMRLIYGTSFHAAGKPLAVMSVVCLTALLSGHYRFGLIAAGRQSAEMLTSALGAGIAIIAIPLGYAFGGLTGAAFGLLAADVAVWLSAWWCARRLLGLEGHARLLLRPAAVFALGVGAGFRLPLGSSMSRTIFGVSFTIIAALVLDSALRIRAAAGLAELGARLRLKPVAGARG